MHEMFTDLWLRKDKVDFTLSKKFENSFEFNRYFLIM